MLKEFETTELKTIFTTEGTLHRKVAEVKIRCGKDIEDKWILTISSIDDKPFILTLYDKAQLISELLAKDEIGTISYKDYNTTFELSGELTVVEVLVEMSKKM